MSGINFKVDARLHAEDPVFRMDIVVASIGRPEHGESEGRPNGNTAAQSQAGKRKVIDATRRKIAPIIKFQVPKVAFIMGIRFIGMVKIMGKTRTAEGKTQTVVAVYFFASMPRL